MSEDTAAVIRQLKESGKLRPTLASCETHGHIFGFSDICIFCRKPRESEKRTQTSDLPAHGFGGHAVPGCDTD